MAEASRARTAIVGVAEHVNAAVLVTVASDGALLDRRRIELTEPGLPTHPHHHEGSWAMGRYLQTPGARAISLADAVALVTRVRTSAERGARDNLAALAASLPVPVAGIAIRACPSMPSTTEARIADHRAQTQADSVMYREAMAAAAATLGWPVTWYDADAMVRGDLDARVQAMGRSVGPPWQAKHKVAAAAALAATVLRVLVAAVVLTAQLSAFSQSVASPSPPLVERFLAEPIFWRQFEIAKALAASEDASVLIRLEPLLRSDDRHVRGNAAFVFARLGDPRGLATIAEILTDRSARPLRQGIPMVVEPGSNWLPQQIRADRYHAVHLLGELRDRRGVALLLPVLGDPDVNYHAAWALGLIGDRRAVKPLIRALDDRDALMRVSAIQALQVLRAREAVPKIRTLLNDRAVPQAGDRVPVGDTAKAAIAALSTIGSEGSRP